VLGALKRAGAGVVRCEEAPASHEWEVFLTSLLFVGEADETQGRISRLQRRGTERLVRHIFVGPPVEGEGQLPDQLRRREAAKQTYARSVAVTKELFQGARMGRTANLKEVRHALHNIVDQVLDNEASLSGLSTLKDYDDYAFTHSVNVCIFCVALGKRLGLTKSQLYDLGMAALVYDLGMSRVPREIVTKEGGLTAAEQEVVESHTWLGALSIFELRDFGEVPVRSMVAAYEHHLKVDGTGYPTTRAPRKPSIFSRIIAVADAFDAATKPRAYTEARPADEVLREFWGDPTLGFDPVVVKALINLLGIYPVGTLVILDSFELAIVHAPNPDMAHIHRPIVRIISDADGTWLDDPPLADLADLGPESHFTRSIIKVTDPARYGIEVSDYFV
jgi:HD-GYP domain-containing protein (c-di-GMP phosphodiesterase class II)